MAFLNETFLEIWIFLLCVNGGILIVHGLVPDTPIRTPFDITTSISGTTPPALYNSTSSSASTLTKNVTTNVLNSTNSHVLSPIQDYFFYPLNILWFFVQMLTGGFVFQVLGMFGLPSIAIYVFQGIIGIFLVRSILYYMTGR